jgi:hypothetical protein
MHPFLMSAIILHTAQYVYALPNHDHAETNLFLHFHAKMFVLAGIRACCVSLPRTLAPCHVQIDRKSYHMHQTVLSRKTYGYIVDEFRYDIEHSGLCSDGLRRSWHIASLPDTCAFISSH